MGATYSKARVKWAKRSQVGALLRGELSFEKLSV